MLTNRIFLRYQNISEGYQLQQYNNNPDREQEHDIIQNSIDMVIIIYIYI